VGSIARYPHQSRGISPSVAVFIGCCGERIASWISVTDIQARKLPSGVGALRFEQNEVPTMSKTERKDKSTKGTQENNDDEEKLVGVSPQEKLHGVPPRDSAVPGAQNPDSVEIKKEVNPNTE